MKEVIDLMIDKAEESGSIIFDIWMSARNYDELIFDIQGDTNAQYRMTGVGKIRYRGVLINRCSPDQERPVKEEGDTDEQR